MSGKSSVCLVGAGFISEIHAEAISSISGLKVTAVADVNRGAAQALADKCGADNVFGSTEEAIASGTFGRAHILVPPHLHAAVAKPFVEAKIPTLMEKPICASAAECESLLREADQSGGAVGVNQNFVYHPALLQLRARLDSGEVGPLRHLTCIYNVPLRQLAAGQFGHWMFWEPGNILLEQAVHPLSQIVEIAGNVQSFTAQAGEPVTIAPGVPFYDSAQISLKCARVPAQLQFAVGQEFPLWQLTAICDDGIIVADILNNRTFIMGRGRWLEATDKFLSGSAMAARIATQSAGNAVNYALSMLGVGGNRDPFYQSMKGSISAFHAAVSAGTKPRCDAEFGVQLVRVCEEIGQEIFQAAEPESVVTADCSTGCDVAVLGGTGFIGRYVVGQLVDAGKRVAVMARGTTNLPEIYHHRDVTVVRGNVRNAEDVVRAIGDAPVVINLAHGGGGGSWSEVEAAMVGSANIVADTCLEKGVRRLVHVGSIAGLYLGDKGDVVTGATPPDPLSGDRADYSRGKAETDSLLLRLHRERGLPVCILRPGVVVGEGGPPFHSGLGFFNTDQYCMGWNRGTNPVPFVLASDTASAVIAACDAPDVEGKCYNLVGGAEMNARDYITALASAMGRPLHYHAQSVAMLQAAEVGKWLIKRAGGRKVPFPSYRDLKSRGMAARFDCTDVRRDLGWKPVDDETEFRRQAIDIFAVTHQSDAAGA